MSVTESATLQNLVVIRDCLVNGAPSYDGVERLACVETYIQGLEVEVRRLCECAIKDAQENAALKSALIGSRASIASCEKCGDRGLLCYDPKDGRNLCKRCLSDGAIYEAGFYSGREEVIIK